MHTKHFFYINYLHIRSLQTFTANVLMLIRRWKHTHTHTHTHTPCECVCREVQMCLTLHIGAIATRSTGNDAPPYRRKGHLIPSATKHTLQGGPGGQLLWSVSSGVFALGGVWTFLSVWVWTNAFKEETLRISACHVHVQSEFLVRNQHFLLCLSLFSKSFLLLSSLEVTGISWTNVEIV